MFSRLRYSINRTVGSRPGSVAAVAGQRDIGPVGTASRLAAGAAAVAVPVVLAGFSWSDAAIALLALPVIAALVAPVISWIFGRLHRKRLRSPRLLSALQSVTLCVVMVVANDVVVAPTTLNGNVTLFVWLGASMLVAAVRGYGGCEILAIPNLIRGRRDQIDCMLYTAIDSAEAKHRSRPAQTTKR
jgi:Family of unknown function (DUF6410)